MGWTSPKVLAGLIGGVALLVAFGLIETRVSDPMMDLRLFRIRAFAAGQIVNFLASMARGGLQFMLIIWLQGIWLPLHGYDFASTPLWAGIYMLPLTIGFLVAGPASGALSDRFGARAFSTGGLLLTAATFGGLMAIPADFDYRVFAVLLALNGIGMGLMAAPNSAAIMNSVPAAERGAASGVRATGMNAGMVLSMGGFFTLMAVGLASRLPASLYAGLTRLGVTPDAAHTISQTPPVGTLFAAFLGDNPVRALMAQVDPAAAAAGLRGGRGDPDRPLVLPAPAGRPVPAWPGHRLRCLDRDAADRRGGLAAARRAVRARRAGRADPDAAPAPAPGWPARPPRWTASRPGRCLCRRAAPLGR